LAADNLDAAQSVITTYFTKLDDLAPIESDQLIARLEAMHLLRERGLAARRLEHGLPEWRAAGLPVVVPPAAP
jgi:hypothetical protein